MKVLAVIPARGGSKGIPRKNVRLMNGKPLIYYAITHALKCTLITDTVVTTDDEEIKRIASIYGAEVVNRSEGLSLDTVTLDPVVYDAVMQMEQKNDYRYDVVITLQPTSPLLSETTLTQALTQFVSNPFGSDTYISAVNRPHLAWTKENGAFVPLYQERLNRQQLPPHLAEAGAFVISQRSNVKETSRFGQNVTVYEIPDSEGIDIDSPQDWILCEQALNKKKIVLRTDGYSNIGMGHIYRCISIAQSLMEHDVTIVMSSEHKEGINKVQSLFLPNLTVHSDDEFLAFLETEQPDIVVYDCLDTEYAFMREIKKRVKRLVTIEDMGTGKNVADAVINALYQEAYPVPNHFYGEQYICLRDEFLLCTEGRLQERFEKPEILILFGGADPSNLTGRLYQIAKQMNHETEVGFHFTFITGPAYDCAAHGVVTSEQDGIIVQNDVPRVSDFMRVADVAVTSQGRTVYELAATRVPAIVLAQNEREQLHRFACMENGFLNLGLGSKVADETVKSTLQWLIETPGIRAEMKRLMNRHSLADGIQRVKRIILGEY